MSAVSRNHHAFWQTRAILLKSLRDVLPPGFRLCHCKTQSTAGKLSVSVLLPKGASGGVHVRVSHSQASTNLEILYQIPDHDACLVTTEPCLLLAINGWLWKVDECSQDSPSNPQFAIVRASFKNDAGVIEHGMDDWSTFQAHIARIRDYCLAVY